ncbi:ArgE/DapE family deacylase [soil metagenome]
MSDVVELLSQLVRIGSVNPDGEPGTDRIGEADCANFLATWLRECGAESWLDEVFHGRPNVVGRFPSDKAGKPRLLFAPHTDTVSVLGMTIEPFSGEVKDGKVWGRGSSDTKGPMAAMLTALKDCREIIPTLSHEIWFAGLMSEETGQHGAKALAAREKFDFVVVGEPTDLQTVYTHKGSAWVTLRVRGKAVHASKPERGENAIYKMLEVLAYFKETLTVAFGRLHDDVLGSPTFNVGTIQGGSKVNIVPDICEAKIDMRTLPGQEVGPILDEAKARFAGLEIEIVQSNPLKTDINHPVIDLLAQGGAKPVGAPWFCDAAIFAAVGTPAVAIGPGSIAQAHTADEFISVADLEAGAEFFTNFLKKLQ